ncbi:MAG: hotdog fold thioesterase [Deinococcota bacterium]|jgi:uncharacterized protein (TIGR00369 family)|nr:hotdog fold thioesterase [Deinococcota bacterium]
MPTDATPADPIPIDDEAFRRVVEEFIPFNRYLGLKLEAFDLVHKTLTTRLTLRPEYVGNPVRQMPHGGIISFMIDATAGSAAALAQGDMRHIDKVATIDMRVDYLKASKGKVLTATAKVVRSGNRVVMVRTDVHDDLEVMVAAGSNVFHIVK